MGKARTNISVDEEVLEAAREEGLNVSKVAEKALKKKIKLLRHGKIPEEIDNKLNSENNKNRNSENGASGGEYTK